ncbi:serine hydrolase domain-containing protein [Sphingopyxis sp. MWB1]|uniref:serine hydrolase domain-containing protein n=1 Tax=Sphingopyxis sp. MWB1 TaxID=1537715 RepID=UPI0009DCAA54|nr:serine hydrolase [Sphingopyxis sp. MWB1]
MKEPNRRKAAHGLAKLSGIAALLFALSPAPPLAAAEIDPALARAWAAGYRAAFTCSSLWNGAGKPLAAIERDELTHIYPEIEAPMRELKAEVDATKHRVTVRYRADMPPRIAQWTGDEGCVTFPIGTSIDAVDPRAIEAKPVSRARINTHRWPMGDADAFADMVGPHSPFALLGDDVAAFGGRTSSLLIVKDRKIVLERYYNGHGPYVAQRTFSVAKSMAATLVGHAVDRGQFDVKAPALIAEWQAPGDPRAAITTEQLLRMASGLTSDTAGNRTDAIYMGGASVRQWTTQWPLLNPPGSEYRYANNDTLLATLSLKAGLARAGQRLDPAAFFDRLGMTRTFVEADAQGDYILSSQVWTTARDLARLGLLYQNDGLWRGERLLPPGWRDFVTAPIGPQPDGPFGYGAGFWLLNASPGIPADAFGAFGNRGQYMVVIPSRRLIVVRQGYDDSKERLDIAALVRAAVEADAGVANQPAG